MLSQEDFTIKATLLGSKLSELWLFTHQALTQGLTPERTGLIIHILREANKLHAEMFPGFEHALYGDDYISMLEGNDESGDDHKPAQISMFDDSNA